jgi:hypothetical protein
MSEQFNSEHAIAEITESLKTVPSKCEGRGDDGWTGAVKSVVITVAKQFGKENKVATTLPKGCDQQLRQKVDDGEWLFDLTWYQEEHEWRMRRVVLVMESEWNRGPDEQRTDFQKLLVAKAEIKLFVFQENTEDDVSSKADGFVEMINAFDDGSPKEIYLFAGLVLDQKPKYFKFYSFLPGSSGKVALKSAGIHVDPAPPIR